VVFWATVCKTVRPMPSDRCPVCLSVCLSVLSVCGVGVLWPNGWMDKTWHAGLLAAEIFSLICGTPANFNRFRVLASLYCSDVAQRKPTKLSRCLAVSWDGTLTSGAVVKNFVRCKIGFASKSWALLYCPRCCSARHRSSGHQSNFVAWYKE